MKKQKLLLLLVPLLLVTSCGKTYIASVDRSFEAFPENPISPEEAVELANPYLDKTFELRSANRQFDIARKPTVWITLKGQQYYIIKDNYISKYIPSYQYHAVKVNKKTGKVSPPK